MKSKERTPRERETLMFATGEEAREFNERAVEKIQAVEQSGVKRKREAVGEMVAREMDNAGYPVETISHPWEHTSEEHEEAQSLVDMAFDKDLQAALRSAESSEHYPRVLDLFHDVLTNEMYPLIEERKLNRQALAGWILLAVGVMAVGVLALLFVLINV